MKHLLLILLSLNLSLSAAEPQFAPGVKVDKFVKLTDSRKGRALLTPDKNIISKENLVYDSIDGMDLKLDLYRPKGKGPFPCAVLLHGGGWTGGNKESFRPMAHALAKKGFVAVTIQYRLATQARFPGAVEDAKQAIRWLRKHAGKYSIDPKRIGGVGGSAGGHLIGMVAVSQDSGKFDRAPQAKESCAVQCAIMMGSGVDQVTRSKESKKPIKNCVIFFGGTIDEAPEMYAAGSPITHLSKQTPPLLILEGENDRPGQRYLEFRKKLDALGVPNELVVIEGAKHGQWGAHPWFSSFADETARLLKAHLP